MFPHDHAADLARLDRDARLRRLRPAAGADFASNDYLALAGSAVLRDAARAAIDAGVPCGSAGSRLLRGNHPAHEALEAQAAQVFGTQSALLLGSGYAANLALVSTLPQRGDLIVCDALVHASVHDGLALARAPAAFAAHNDADAFADAIAGWRRSGGRGTAWIVVESLYSMDGDRAPLADLVQVAQRQGAVLVIDEAHATGVFGPGGRGLAAALAGRGDVILLKTFGKALGCEGAVVCGPRVVRDFLVARGRPFIFSTAMSPLMACVAQAALHTLDAEPGRRAALHARIDHANERFARLPLAARGSHILAPILGDDRRTMAVAARLQADGFDVRGIRPPTVPDGTARLRIAITNHAAPAAIDALADRLEELV